MEDHAESLASVLDDLGLAGCGVVGHSLGGAVAIALAAKRPDLVGCLILAEANLDPGGGALTQAITSFTESEFIASGHAELLDSFEKRATDGDKVSPIALGIFRTADSRALHRSAMGVARGTHPTMRELLVQMTIPRVYVFGELSLPDEDYTRLPSTGVEVAVVPDAGHGMTAENPPGFSRAIADFLTRWDIQRQHLNPPN